MLYVQDEERVGIPFHPDFVSVVEGRWWFIHPLLRRYDEWKFYRRLLPLVACVHPKTGGLDIKLGALAEDTDDREVYASPQAEWARTVADEFWGDSVDLDRALWDALAMVNPREYREMVELYADEINVGACGKYADIAERAQTDGAWQFHYLERFDEASRIVGKWEERLRSLRNDEFMDLWRSYASAAGSQRGGRKSGQTRSKLAKLTVDDAVKMHGQLLAQGKAPRDIAALIAKRRLVSPDHVRALLREARARRERS